MRKLNLIAILCIFAAPLPASAQEASVEQGRYVAMTAGCNDCHTAGYGPAEGNVPETEWLKGDSMGWRGPWGTTYAVNLRLRLSEMNEDEWIEFAKTFKTRPPMPWFNVHAMNETDLRSFHKYVMTFEDKGEPAPDYVPPDREPEGPFIQFPEIPH
jgi:mono/diheme cytochrome c family protein